MITALLNVLKPLTGFGVSLKIPENLKKTKNNNIKKKNKNKQTAIRMARDFHIAILVEYQKMDEFLKETWGWGCGGISEAMLCCGF